MSTRLSRWALLTGLAFALPPLGPTVAEAQADVPDAANLYPGRYAAVCTPAPISRSRLSATRPSSMRLRGTS